MMQYLPAKFPFSRLGYVQQPFGLRVSCVLDESFVKKQTLVTGFAIEATGGMEPYFGLGPFTKGVIRELGKSLGFFLGTVDQDGGTTIIYWGTNGESTIQPLAYRNADQWKYYSFGRPIDNFGRKSCILPALKYFLEGDFLLSRPIKRRNATPGIFVFLLDGALDDFRATMDYLGTVVKGMAEHQRKLDHIIFIGFGDRFEEENQGQIQALASINRTTNSQMITSLIVQNIDYAFEEIKAAIMPYVNIPGSGAIYNGAGQVVQVYPEGLPGVLQFQLPIGSNSFIVKINDKQYNQELVL